MGGSHYRHAAGVLPPEVAPESEAGLGVEAGSRFVEEHDFGVADKGKRDVEASLLAAGKGAIMLGKTVVKPQLVAQL